MSTSDLASLASASSVEQLVSLTASQCVIKQALPSASNRSASTTRGGSPSRRSVSSLQTVNSTLSVDDASEIISLGDSIADDDWDGDDTEWLTDANCKLSAFDTERSINGNESSTGQRCAERRKANIESTLRWMNEGFAKPSTNGDGNGQQVLGGDELDGLKIASRNAIRSAELTNVHDSNDAISNYLTASQHGEEADSATQGTLRPGVHCASASCAESDGGVASADGLSSSGSSLTNMASSSEPPSDSGTFSLAVTGGAEQHYGSLQSLTSATTAEDSLPEAAPATLVDVLGEQTFRRSSQPMMITNGSATITKRSPTHINVSEASGIKRTGSARLAARPGWAAPASAHSRNDALQLARHSVFGAAAELASVADPALVMLEEHTAPVVPRVHCSNSTAKNRHSVALVNYNSLGVVTADTADDAASIVSSNAGSSTHSLETAAVCQKRPVRPSKPAPASPKKTANARSFKSVQPARPTDNSNKRAPRSNALATVKQHSVDESRVRHTVLSSASSHAISSAARSDAILVPKPAGHGQPSPARNSRIPAPTHTAAPPSRLTAPKATARSVSVGQPANALLGLTLPGLHTPGDCNTFF